MTDDIAKKFIAARSEFPHTKNVTYFNSGSFGPYSTRVKNSLNEHIAARAEADVDQTAETFKLRQTLRKGYAALIGAREDQIGLGLNTSFGLNVAAFGLPLEKGDQVLVSDVEFPAVIYTFKAAAEARGIELKYVPSVDRKLDINLLREAITDKTKVLAISWVQFFNGYKNDLAALRDLCREQNLYFIVDGIQGTGVEPLDVLELDIDLYTTGCQKWMLAPQGCGFFFISDRIRDRLTPPFASWLGVEWNMQFGDLFKYDLEFLQSAEQYELGYYVELNLVGMNAALQMFQELGVENIQRHNYSLIDRLAGYIKSTSRYTVTSSMKPKHRSSIFTFTCDGYEALHKELLRNRIICVQREGSIRISVHLFNNEDDIDKVIEVLKSYDT